MQATQIHVMRHQHTELPQGKYKKQKPQTKPRPTQTNSQIKGKQATTRRPLTLEVYTNRKIDVANVEIPSTWKVLLALQKSTNVRVVINFATSPACVF